jgi:outer membrane immunogenic protein
MKKLIFAVAAAMVVVVSSALAADVRKPTAKRAPTPSAAGWWSGCHVGGHAGLAWFDGGSDSGLVGGHLGCNYYVSPQWVVGVEGDVERVGSGGGGGGSNWGASIRGRVGYSMGAALLYGTAGLAVLDRANDTLSGWTAGGGVEYAFAPSWTGRVEYRHTNLEGARNDNNSLRVGVSYKFGNPFGGRF